MQDMFVPSLIAIGLLVLGKKILFFNINISEYCFPYCGPHDPWRPWFQETWIYIISESFHINMTYSGSVVLEKIFKWSNPIFAFLRLSPLWRRPGPSFEQFRIAFTQGWFIPSLIEIGLLVLEILKNFQCIFTLLQLSPLGEGQPPSF
jgi:hypothetical protein